MAVFVDRTAEAGLDFRHDNGMTGQLYLLEIMGSGVGLLDHDGDGDLDLYLVQGGPIEEPGERPPDRLLRNERIPEGELRFTDVTETSGIATLTRGAGYGMGLATGDFDDDGHVDLFLTRYGADQLLRGRGDGTFEDASAALGGPKPHPWSTAATFFDGDADGDLDLFVTTYVDFRLDNHVLCRTKSGLPDYCLPTLYDPLPDRLLENQGDGTFRDVSEPAGLTRLSGSGLGAVAADFDGDGDQDLYVANDNMANRLWLNQLAQGGGLTFRDEAMLAGAALSREGRPEGSMGVVVEDLDGDGDEDVFLTHLAKETNTFYRNAGGGLFDDRSRESGLGTPSLPFTSFGTAGLDFDNDGHLDLLVVSGEVRLIEEQLRAGVELPLEQTPQLFRGLGDGTFEDVTARAGASFAEPRVGRGAAVGDLDNDGDPDAVVTHNDGQALLLINQVGAGNPWLGLRLLLSAGGRDALGARVAVRLAGTETSPEGRTLWRRVATDGSYLSAKDPRILVGVGEARVVGLRVHWPGGLVEDFAPPPLGAYTTLVRGTGQEVSP